jgi:hypothetical protein
MLSGAGFGQPHEMLQLEVVIQLGPLIHSQASALLSPNQIHYSRSGRFGRPERGNIVRTDTGRDKVDDLFVCTRQTHALPPVESPQASLTKRV